ncbi:CD276 antigen-like [Chanos chanos]|uniref:CD276 antigen-like n=1 Tax=Chanos chanos TaxID=29144 RepID=A0A6J2WDY8_CHACN|nr:CD276 antigen-like [Chanos chanos]
MILEDLLALVVEQVTGLGGLESRQWQGPELEGGPPRRQEQETSEPRGGHSFCSIRRPRGGRTCAAARSSSSILTTNEYIAGALAVRKLHTKNGSSLVSAMRVVLTTTRSSSEVTWSSNERLNDEWAEGVDIVRIEPCSPRSQEMTPLLCSSSGSKAEFKVSVPNTPQVALHGQSVILSCSFSVGTSWELSSTVIIWKRGLEVIHDFHHSQDQLDWQSPHFASRTSLFTSEIKNGNASLKLDRTTPEDEGIYSCSVSTDMGSQKQSFHLKIAAHYPEPHLQLSKTTHGINLFMKSEGGYPAPTLLWLNESTEDLTNHTVTHLTQDTHTKLYNVYSTLTLTGVTNLFLTFVLRNEDLQQEIRREIELNLISDTRDFEN